MATVKTYPVSSAAAKKALIDHDSYRSMYQQSIEDPATFWAEQANELIDWFTPWNNVEKWDFHKGEVEWFTGAKLNASYNCIDRHLETRADQAAIIWQGDESDQQRTITYRKLYEEVSRFSNALKGLGIGKGDRVCIYMPMIPEAAFAMLACTRIGAMHSVVFAGYSSEPLRQRIEDFDCSIVITADSTTRGGKSIDLKEIVDDACDGLNVVRKVIVVKHKNIDIDWMETRDVWYHDIVTGALAECPPVEMDAMDPLFIIYTSGSTGQPKGALHSTGGYLLYAAMTHKYIFDHQEGDIFWCTANIGWITGHTYLLYGPLLNGGTTLMYEGIPTYPNPGRMWEVVEQHKVTSFYTAPTIIRSLMVYGDKYVKQHDRSSLKILGSVGEPINPEAWEWYYHIVGEGRCPIVDTWWQTETGGILIAPLPNATDLKPGSATLPFFGVQPAILDENGELLEGEVEGNLVITRPWPGQITAIFGDTNRFKKSYFSQYPGYFHTGDRVRRDADGYYWITGRTDDVLKISGHRIGTAEVESALTAHPTVAEAAVVAVTHPLKGNCIYAYVTLMKNAVCNDELLNELRQRVRDDIGSIATPQVIQCTANLPKTRSGKILRRILRKIANNKIKKIGDISTLADPTVIDDLIDNRIDVTA